MIIQRSVTAAIWDDGMADNSPLFRTISRYIDEALLAEIARAYAGGRLLLIGTSNLDAQMPVIWNIGAIASSGHPKALDTVRRILLASSAIPGAFSPVLFDVTLDGKPFQELHVDGGAFAQVFLYPNSVSQYRRERMARRPAGRTGPGLGDPQRPARSRMGLGGPADDGHRQPGGRLDDLLRAGTTTCGGSTPPPSATAWTTTWPSSAATSPWNTTSPSSSPTCARCSSTAGSGRWRAMPG